MHPYRFWLYRAELAASALGTALLVMTLAHPVWIERWFGQAPDDSDGNVERWIVGGGFLIAAVLAAVLAIRERRRCGPAAAVP